MAGLETMNGQPISWSEIGIAINITGATSTDIVDIKSIDHEAKVDRGEKRGVSGGRVRGRTSGQGSSTASATFYREGLRDLKKLLLAVAPTNSLGQAMLSRVGFDIIIKHSFEGDPEIHCTKLNGCHLDKDSGKHAEGSDPETVDVDLNPVSIVEVIDGKDTVLL